MPHFRTLKSAGIRQIISCIWYRIERKIAFQKIFYGNFRPNDCYFKFDGYANLESIDWLKDEIDLDEIADYIIDNENSLGNNEIQKILDEDDNEEEEEE